MKTWIKRTLIGVVAAGTLFGGLAAWAHSNGWGHHRFGWTQVSEQDVATMKARFIERAAGKLNLDAAQQAKLGLLADAVRVQRNAIVATSADPRTEIKGLIAGNTFDRAKAQQLVNGKLAAVNSGAPAVISAMGDFYDSLRPEQQTQLRELLDRMSKRGHRGGKSGSSNS